MKCLETGKICPANNLKCKYCKLDECRSVLEMIEYDEKRLKEKKLDVALLNAELMKLVQNDNELKEKFMRIYKANESLFNENKEVFEELLNEIDGNGKTLTLN